MLPKQTKLTDTEIRFVVTRGGAYSCGGTALRLLKGTIF